MADWNVNIVQTASGEAEFVIDGGQPGQPLEATQGDLVSWYNKTDDPHQLWQTDEDYNPLGQSGLPGLIKPGLSSDAYDCAQPLWGPASWTVYYYCSLHPENPGERGSIEVTALPIAINYTVSNGVVGLGTNTMTGSANPLNVAPGQTLYWSNRTKQGQSHWPWETDSNFNPLPTSNLSDQLDFMQTSSIYTAPTPQGSAPETIYYCCKLHPTNQGEQATIVVQPQGD